MSNRLFDTDPDKFFNRFAKFAVAIWIGGVLLSLTLVAVVIWAIVKIVAAVTA